MRFYVTRRFWAAYFIVLGLVLVGFAGILYLSTLITATCVR